MKNLFIVLLVFLTFQLSAQEQRGEDPRIKYANTINTEDLHRHLTILSADDMEGRETGTEGQYKAARYLEEIIEGYGLPGVGPDNSYSQAISFISERWDKIELDINGKSQRHLWDYYSYPSKNADRAEVRASEVVFLGYGIESENYDDFAGENLQGKTILIMDGEPKNREGAYHTTGTTEPSEWSTDLSLKLKAAKSHGIETVIILDPNFQRNLSSARKIALDSRMHMGFSEKPAEHYSNSIYVSAETARDILGSSYSKVVKARRRIEKKGKPRSVNIEADIRLLQQKRVKELLGENMLAFVEGTDLKDEVVIVTAHYDHVGRRGNSIFNGADDNGSGTSTVLEVAQAFALAKEAGEGPRRSMLFMLVSGEEKGLLGSQFYVENPIFPLESTVANINVDMVGRVDEKHEGNPDYIYVIGSDRLSTELHQINETANSRHTQLELDYTYNAEDDPNRYYYRSDHYNFAERGIPAVFYFNGTHEDYHQATDTIDKINFEKMVKIGQLVFHTAWELANRDERIRVDVGVRP